MKPGNVRAALRLVLPTLADPPDADPGRLAPREAAVTYPTILVRSARVLEEVSHERAAQDAKWGEQNHPNGTGDDRHLLCDVALPTYGTLASRARTVTDAHARQGNLTYADILMEEVGEGLAEGDPRRLRAELIQVAAVAVAWVEKIDRDDRRRRLADILAGGRG